MSDDEMVDDVSNEEIDDVEDDEEDNFEEQVKNSLIVKTKSKLQNKDSDVEEQEEDLFPDDEPIKSTLKRTRSFEVIPHEEIVKESKTLIDDIMQVCGIQTAAAATILLRYFKYVTVPTSYSSFL